MGSNCISATMKSVPSNFDIQWKSGYEMVCILHYIGVVSIIVVLISVNTHEKCINLKQNFEEILTCCKIDDWLPERDLRNCTERHKFQFSESRKELQFCVESCYYRSLGLVDEFEVDLQQIRQINSNRNQFEQEAINQAATTCYKDKYEEIEERLMYHRTECNSYPYLYGQCIMNEIYMNCHEQLWRNSTVCDSFRARDFC